MQAGMIKTNTNRSSNFKYEIRNTKSKQCYFRELRGDEIRKKRWNVRERKYKSCPINNWDRWYWWFKLDSGLNIFQLAPPNPPPNIRQPCLSSLIMSAWPQCFTFGQQRLVLGKKLLHSGCCQTTLPVVPDFNSTARQLTGEKGGGRRRWHLFFMKYLKQ